MGGFQVTAWLAPMFVTERQLAIDCTGMVLSRRHDPKEQDRAAGEGALTDPAPPEQSIFAGLVLVGQLIVETGLGVPNPPIPARCM